MNEQTIRAHLAPDIPVTLLSVTDSTNRIARDLANAGETLHLILAERQTGGRGRLGRSFHSPEGGLYLSLLCGHGMPACDAMRLTPAAAVAVSRAISRVLGIEVGIKWVNDLYLDEKKVCGILTEAQTGEDGRLRYAVIGIGVNIEAPADGFPPEIAGIAGSLYAHGESPTDTRERLAAAIANELAAMLDAPASPEVLTEYRARSVVIGRELLVTHVIGGESIPAFAESIDDECRLIVRYPDGTREALAGGEVSTKINK